MQNSQWKRKQAMQWREWTTSLDDIEEQSYTVQIHDVIEVQNKLV